MLDKNGLATKEFEMEKSGEMLREFSLTQLQLMIRFDWGFVWTELVNLIIAEKEIMNV